MFFASGKGNDGGMALDRNLAFVGGFDRAREPAVRLTDLEDLFLIVTVHAWFLLFIGLGQLAADSFVRGTRFSDSAIASDPSFCTKEKGTQTTANRKFTIILESFSIFRYNII